jgi:hypothetical protein
MLTGENTLHSEPSARGRGSRGLVLLVGRLEWSAPDPSPRWRKTRGFRMTSFERKEQGAE